METYFLIINVTLFSIWAVVKGSIETGSNIRIPNRCVFNINLWYFYKILQCNALKSIRIFFKITRYKIVI